MPGAGSSGEGYSSRADSDADSDADPTPTPTPAPTSKLPLFGAAVGSNGSPAALEASAGRAFGIRRTYWSGSQVTSAINTAAADIAAGRVPWISFKLPASWSAMASGSQDAWLRDLGTRLRALNGEVWVALHHEPENDGDIEQWKAMQRRAAPLVDGGDADVKFTIVFTGWHQFFSTAATYKMATVWPGDNTGMEVIGIDPYNEYGVTKSGSVNLKASEFDNQTKYYDQLAAFAKAHGTNWAVAETGFTDRAVADKGVGWLAKAYDDMANHPILPGLALTYFDSSLNPIGDSTWAVEKVAAKRAAFVALVKRSGLPATKPTAPRIKTAYTGGAGRPIQARATWWAPVSNGGAAIKTYRVVALKHNSSGAIVQRFYATRGATIRSHTFTLPAGRYKFRVQATNAKGASAWSAKSNTVSAR